MKQQDLGERFVRWAVTEPSVCMVALIGSRARALGDFHAADDNSDWDFQVVTEKPEVFATSGWLDAIDLSPITYVERRGRLGSARKVTAIFAEGEIDWVLLPAESFRSLLTATMAGLKLEPPPVAAAVAELAAVLQGGYELLKGAGEFSEFYRHVANRGRSARLSNSDVRVIADGYVCDYVSTLRKIDRGELLAGQRWLHHQLVEVNFRLLHELRLRAGLPTLPDARRLEFSSDPHLDQLSIDARLTRDSLFSATEKSAATFRGLMGELVGPEWKWPDLSTLRLRTE